MGQSQTYVLILRDSLINKKKVLMNLIELTKRQADVIKNGNPDIDEFDNIFNEKNRQLDMLNMLDDGFQNVYDNVKTEVLARPEQYKELLREIQVLINEVVESGSKLESLEINNKDLIEAFIHKKKQDIKAYRSNNNSAASYYSNMANQHISGQSYFMDKKK